MADLAVQLLCDRFGQTWAYVEIELSARGIYRIRAKLRGYGAPGRPDDFPLLALCYDEAAEMVFHRVGQEYDPLLRLFTATLDRVAELGVLGQGTWSYYGELAYIVELRRP